MRHPVSSVAWLRTLRLTRLAVDTSDDRSHSLPAASSAVLVSTKQKQTLRSSLFRRPEHCDRLPRGVFHVENALQTRWGDRVADLQHRLRRPDSETGISRYCVALLRHDNSNRFVGPVVGVRRTAA